MMKPDSRIKNPQALMLLILLLLCLFSSQLLMAQAVEDSRSPTALWLSMITIGIAVLLLVAGERLPEGEHGDDLAAGGRLSLWTGMGFAFLYSIERNWRSMALALSFLATSVLLRRLPLMGAGDSYNGVLLLWVCAMLLFLLAVSGEVHWELDWKGWWQEHQRQFLAVAAMVLLAFVLRAWRIDTIPFTLSGDEGSQGLEAVQVIEGKLRNPFSTGWLGVPTMSFFFNSLSIRLLGQTVTALRLPWTMVGTATVLIAFFLVKRLKGTPLALMTAALLATYHFHIHFSRLGSNQIADPFFLSLSLLLLSRALDRNQRLDWALTGMITGLALYFYAGARLTPVVIAVVLAYLFVRQPGSFRRKYGLGIAIAIVALLIAGAPMIQYAIRFPNEFNARLNQVGILQSGWLEDAMEAREQSAAAVLFDQFRRAALAFNYYPDRTVWYGLHQPLLNPFFGMVFLLGLGYATLRLWGGQADWRSAPLVAWWWGGMLLGGMLTESPPSSQRLITLAVPVCFFIALALWRLIQLAGRGVAGLPADALSGLMVMLFALSSLATYFLDYTPQRIYGGPYAELATEIVPILSELSPEHRIYFMGAPWMHWGIATLPYLVPDADAVDVTVPLAEYVNSGAEIPLGEVLFVFIPLRLNELDLAQEIFPQGKRRDIYSPVDGRLMVTLYQVS